MKIFLDDQKEPTWYHLEPESVCCIRSGEKALQKAKKHGQPLEILYLDHDLGEGMSGYTVLAKLVEDFNLPPQKVIIISLNPVGVARIKSLCEYEKIPYEIHGIDHIDVKIIEGQSG